jgi:geranylgeranyl diphosphate synthase type I
MNVSLLIRTYRTNLDQELKDLFLGLDSGLYEMLRYQLGWIDGHGNPIYQPSGKAIRPSLCLLTAESLNGSIEVALPAAAAVELVHNFSLIHDDVQDDDRERRNRPSVWVLWGKPQAINAGTAMRVLASLSMQRLGKQGINSNKIAKAYKILDQATLRLLQGQFLDISFESQIEVNQSDYLRMAEGKTAALFACALELGALVSTEDEKTIQSFSGCGLNLGLGFQIMDDILGIWGDGGKLGKPIGNDIKRKKKSYPIVRAFEVADEVTKRRLVEIYGHDFVSNEDMDEILDILDELKVKTHAQFLVNQYSERAHAYLQRTNCSQWGLDQFAEIINFLVHRES